MADFMKTCSDDDGVDELAMYPFDKIARKTKKGRDTTQKSRVAVEEKRLAESAAKGITSVKYGIGEKAKTTRNTDFQERVNGMYEVMDGRIWHGWCSQGRHIKSCDLG